MESSRSALNYLQRIPIVLIVAFVPNALYSLVVCNSRMHAFLTKEDSVWSFYLMHFREDCSTCWADGAELCKLAGLSPRSELRARIAQRRCRAQWRVKFSTRVFIHPQQHAAEPQGVASPQERVVHPQQPAPPTDGGKGRWRSNRVYPLEVPLGRAWPGHAVATEAAMEVRARPAPALSASSRA